MIEIPKIGQVWIRDGLKREIVDVKFYGRHCKDYDVTWKRPGSEKLTTVWLRNWKTWRNKASMVIDA